MCGMNITFYHVRISPENYPGQDHDGAFHAGLALLPPEQRADVTRYLRPQDQAAALCARLLITRIGQSAGVEAPLDRLRRTAKGKPYFEAGPEFNVSHCRGHVAAVAGPGPLGVDVETPRGLQPEDVKIALRPDEFARIKHSAAPERALLDLWTRKEAVLKTLGEGLHLDPATVAVSGETAVAAGRVLFLRAMPVGLTAVCHAAAFAPLGETAAVRYSLDELVGLLQGAQSGRPRQKAAVL